MPVPSYTYAIVIVMYIITQSQMFYIFVPQPIRAHDKTKHKQKTEFHKQTSHLISTTVLLFFFQYFYCFFNSSIVFSTVVKLFQLFYCFFNTSIVFSTVLLFFAVDRLREHWEDANTKVGQRRSLLDSMLTDSRKFDDAKDPFLRWLDGVEKQQKSFREVGHTVGVLERQIEEQKV